MKPTPTICLSIVSHENDAFIENLLCDLEKYCLDLFKTGMIKKIILTHNTKNHALTLKRLKPALRTKLFIIYNTHPKGFGENHNHAFYTHCDTDYFCVINPDIRLRQNPFNLLLNTLASHPATGVIAPKIMDTQRQVQDNARNFLTFSECFKRVFKLKSSLSLPHPEWVAGMFMLFPKKAYQAVKGFDAGYFLYCEDMDICARLTLKHYRVYYEEGTMVIHSAQRKSHKHFHYFLWHIKSLLRFFYHYYFIFKPAFKRLKKL